MDKKATYFVGIDLGTTHCALAFAKKSSQTSLDDFKIFGIPQLVGPGELAKRNLLPCFRYHAGNEINIDDAKLPFNPKLSDDIPSVVIGEWAKRLGSKTPGRLVASSKSWLTLPNFINDACLPTNALEDVQKVSPILATASLLNYLRTAWDYENPNALLADQTLVITIPASFDEGARQATAEAAEMAGLTKFTLLEEPQAACYHWLSENQDKQARDEKLLLVCDVGGGTTDLSLLKVSSKAGKTQLHRIAVGDHLMLGGDNMDLALASKALLKSAKPNYNKILALSAAAQTAKETLLGEDAPESASLTLLGQGRKLLGQSQTYHLTREETEACLYDDFFPIKSIKNLSLQTKAPLTQMGLPYESDPIITHHLGQFIRSHQITIKRALGLPDDASFQGPDALLLNGSLFKSERMQDRVLKVCETLSSHPIKHWHNSSPDLAVALGAVYSSLSKEGLGNKITGGSARHFFLTLKGDGEQKQAVCLLPKGALENQVYSLNQEFQITLDQDVQFELLSSNADQAFALGEILTINGASDDNLKITALPPLVLKYRKEKKRKETPQPQTVLLSSEYSDIGLLEVFYRGDNALQGQLSFSTRQPKTTYSLPETWPKVVTAISDVFGKSQKSPESTVKNLKKHLEKLLGAKETWSLEINRALCDELLQHSKRRRRSAQHERLWFHLTGFSLRPGFGDAKDPQRLGELWPLYAPGLQYEKESQNLIDWWNFWRRISSGLSTEQQECIYHDLEIYFSEKYFNSNKLQQQLKKQGFEDIIKLVANLEKLSSPEKQQIIQHLLKILAKKSQQPALWWALGRLGSREMLTPNLEPLPVKIAEGILDATLKQNVEKVPQAAFASAVIAKTTAILEQNINDALRLKVQHQLSNKKLPKSWLAIFEGSNNSTSEKAVFGETLPIGTSLKADS